MRTTLINLGIIASLALLAGLVWAGQQRPPDRYLDEIRARSVLRVGTDPSYPPFESVQDGHIVGYDAEFAQIIATDIGVKVEFVPLALDTLYDALAAGKVDLLISALPFIYERQAEVRYSQPYYQAGQVLVVRPGERDIRSVNDLTNREVGVELGSTADTEARRLARTSVLGMQVRATYTSADEVLAALARGEIDAAITDNTSAQAALRAQPGRYSILSPPLTDEPYVIAMPVRADGLATQVDATIARLRASGQLALVMGLAER